MILLQRIQGGVESARVALQTGSGSGFFPEKSDMH
jgi:hypothetical protein